MRRQHRLRRAFLAVVALAAVACASLGVLAGLGVWKPQEGLVGGLSGLRALTGHPAAPPPDDTADPTAGAPVGHDAHALVPHRQRITLLPTQFAAVNAPKKLRGTPWANIAVWPDGIKLMVGDRIISTGYFRSIPHWDGTITLENVAALVAKSTAPEWLHETEPGVFLLQVGLVQAPSTTLTIASPRVRELRMEANPYVYVAGFSSTAIFRGVKVMSWQARNNAPDADATHRRPFISYKGPGSRLDTIDSDFSYLGSDGSTAYGVSWGKGTTGQALRSVFHNNLFGAYTGGAINVSFQDNVFRDNAIYGLDPHTNSTGLTVTGNEAYGNGTHGIIFSKSVINSVVANNHSHDNGANGIMMDEKSDSNVIQNNVTERNGGGGIVLQGSSNVQVIDNVVANNLLGVRVNANELGVAVNNHISGNQITGNHNGIDVYNGTRDTALERNVVRDSQDTGLLLSDPASSLNDTVINARKGVVVGHGTSTLRELSVQQAVQGVVLAAGTSATISSAQIQASSVGIIMRDVATLNVSGPLSTITGARKGVVVRGTANLTNLAMQNITKGVVLDPTARVSMDGGRIEAEKVGLDVQGLGGADRIALHNSEVRAPDPVAGASLNDEAGNDISMTLSWLALAGAIFVGLALVLHLLHRIFSPLSSVRHRTAPATVSS
jgi:parallel beta-helix repeat protein